MFNVKIADMIKAASAQEEYFPLWHFSHNDILVASNKDAPEFYAYLVVCMNNELYTATLTDKGVWIFNQPHGRRYKKVGTLDMCLKRTDFGA